MRTHTLKIWSRYYKAVADGTKTFEYRLNDRDYQVGDILHLHEYDPKADTFSGNILTKRITYLLHAGEEDYVILAIQ